MKKRLLVVIIVVIVAMIILGVSLNQEPKQDITGGDFDNFYTPKKEKKCCENCLAYEEYEDSRDCLEIIREHGGTRHCYLIMEGPFPHVFSMQTVDI